MAAAVLTKFYSDGLIMVYRSLILFILYMWHRYNKRLASGSIRIYLLISTSEISTPRVGVEIRFEIDLDLRATPNIYRDSLGASAIGWCLLLAAG